ncbi:hypothetical protein WICPIJ_008113 [Wickerhamomyces pijperi]|uniref:Uncharacterized protein n=1 Tax=Wickerhamomyces pijperi TaxID=599730 RepID=A0A9P8PYZ5_WICPI|nr:hypothetical protein WICPIJ_008113 [Wickerhamomyces pijperi]
MLPWAKKDSVAYKAEKAYGGMDWEPIEKVWEVWKAGLMEKALFKSALNPVKKYWLRNTERDTSAVRFSMNSTISVKLTAFSTSLGRTFPELTPSITSKTKGTSSKFLNSSTDVAFLHHLSLTAVDVIFEVKEAGVAAAVTALVVVFGPVLIACGDMESSSRIIDDPEANGDGLAIANGELIVLWWFMCACVLFVEVVF